MAAFAAYQIWDRSHDHPAPRHGPATASAAPATAATLAITVTGPKCQVFVRVPNGDILVNRVLLQGQSVRFTEPQLGVVLGDTTAVSVYVNGRLRPPGKAGERVAFTAVRS